jgi:opacity protein-like surface antigen
MKYFLILILIIICVLNVGAESTDKANNGKGKFQVLLFGGINSVSEYGSIEDYVQGGNDFPVTPGHLTSVFGAAVIVNFNSKLALEVGGRFYPRTETTLEDPSDGDTVVIDTAKHFSINANLIYWLGKGNFVPYLTAGTGFDLIQVDDEVYTSELGFDIEFPAPDRKGDLLFNVGAGVQYWFTGSLGVFMDARYIMIFAKPDSIGSINVTAGLSFKI